MAPKWSASIHVGDVFRPEEIKSQRLLSASFSLSTSPHSPALALGSSSISGWSDTLSWAIHGDLLILIRSLCKSRKKRRLRMKMRNAVPHYELLRYLSCFLQDRGPRVLF